MNDEINLFLKNLLFTLVVPGMVAVYVPVLLVWDHSITSGPAAILGLVLLGSGTAVYVWCVWDFATFGRGTPAPIDAPRKLVVRGLYRYVRNPMYIGVLTVVLGLGALFRTAVLLIYASGLWLCVHLCVVFYEERRLRALFGDEYAAYRAGVNRWRPRLRLKSASES